MEFDAILMGMIDPRDIDTLDNFKRNTKKQLEHLKRTKRPQVLTLNGKAAIVVQDATAFAIEQAQADRDFLAGLRESIAQADRGETMTVDEAFARIKDRVKSSPTKTSKARGRRGLAKVRS